MSDDDVMLSLLNNNNNRPHLKPPLPLVTPSSLDGSGAAPAAAAGAAAAAVGALNPLVKPFAPRSSFSSETVNALRAALRAATARSDQQVRHISLLD